MKVCFYSTQCDILLCVIARFSRRNKNKLRIFQPQKFQPQASLKQNLLVLTKKSVNVLGLTAVAEETISISTFMNKICENSKLERASII